MSFHSDLQFDFNKMIAESLHSSEGVSIAELENTEKDIRLIQTGLSELRKLGQIPFLNLPYHNENLDKINAVSRQLRERFKYFVVLGIGGSSLGSLSLCQALQNSEDRASLFVIDNVDIEQWKKVLFSLEFKDSLFIVISKSGTTIETLAAYSFFRDQLAKELDECKLKEHFYFITDPEKNPLRQLAEKEDCANFAVPKGVSGRYSVLSPVGLLSAACLGIDIEELLAGAQAMDKRCQNNGLWQNPAAFSAALHYHSAFNHKKAMRVLMPYCERLESYTEWFAQLWAESLGKAKTLEGNQEPVGQTPIRAMGVTDQHSQLQLYLEGPRDKVITFITVASDHDEVIPDLASEVPELKQLAGKKVTELMEIECQATEQALSSQGVPSCRIHLPKLNEHSFGQLLYFAQVETVITGQLYDINPFDQPAVEKIKRNIKGLLGMKGYEKDRAEIETVTKEPRFIL